MKFGLQIYLKTYKTLFKGNNKDDKWREKTFIGTHHIKILFLPKLICKSNTLSIKIL